MGVAQDLTLGQALRLHIRAAENVWGALARDHRQAGRTADNVLSPPCVDHISSPYVDFRGSTLHE